VARVKGITQFYLPLTRLSTNAMSHPAFTPSPLNYSSVYQPRSITALGPVLISPPTEGRRLSWPGLTCIMCGMHAVTGENDDRSMRQGAQGMDFVRYFKQNGQGL